VSSLAETGCEDAGGWNCRFVFCVAGCTVTTISEDRSTFIFRVKHFDPEDKAATILQNIGAVCPKTQYYSPQICTFCNTALRISNLIRWKLALDCCIYTAGPSG
jgi:hypothetical protein